VSQVDNLIALNDEHPLTTDSLSGSQVVFIDPGVRDLQTILAGIKPGMDVVLLDPNRDALDQIAETLRGHHGISAVHIIADGKAGQIDFSSGALGLGNVTTGSHAADLSMIGSALSANGDLMIWSCNTAAGSTGQAFIDALAQHTSADVAASTGITGAASLGGNWVLEAQTGPIEASVPLTAKGLQQADSAGLDLSALSIIYPMQTVQGAYGSPNNELGFSYGSTGDNVVKDIYTGGHTTSGHYYFNSSKPSDFTVLGDHVIFVASTASDGRELWITDGTSAGTQELKDIRSGTGDAFPGVASSEARAVVGSELFFTANDGTHGIELWKTDGTNSGTQLVDDIDSGSASGNITGMAVLGSSLIFGANDGQTFGSSESNRVGQLWTTDGTTTTKIFTASPGSGASYAPGIYGFVASGSHVFFDIDNGTFNPDYSQIYVTDGTALGTHLLDPSVTDYGGGARNMTDVNGTLYFALDDGDSGAGHGFELWESDGTASGTFLVKDINPGNSASSPYGFAGTTNGEVFFGANDGTHGFELWETDGTAGNAQMVMDINTTSSGASSNPQDLVAIGNEVYFVATDGTNGQQLWETNGTTTQAVTTYATGGFNPGNLTNVNGTLYWVGQNLNLDPAGNMGLYKLAGTTVTEVSGNYSGLSSGDNHGGTNSLGGFAFLGGGVVTQGEPDAFSTDEATSVTGQNLFSDNGNGPDTGTSLSIAQVQGSAGNVGNQITLASGAHLTVNSDGTFTYDPNHAFDYLPSASSGASNLTTTDTFTYQLTGASSATTVTINLSGLDSNDTLTGTAGTDTLVPGTGNDIVNALGGADTINMGANLNAADQIDGGTGNDTVTLNGNYSGGVTFSATTMVNVEAINLAAGHSYKLTTNNATVASGQTLTVDGSGLGSGNALTFNGSAETDGMFVFMSGAGADSLTGGAGTDTFNFAAANLTSADTVNGGTGASVDTLTFTTVGTVAAGAFTHVSHIEKIVLANGTNSLTLSDALVGSSDNMQLLIVSGNAGNDTIDASAVTTAANRVLFSSGAGDDTLTGGAGADTFNFAAPYLTSADTVNGGTGASLDTLTFTTAGTIAASAFAGVSHIEKIVLANGTNSLTLSNALVGSADDAHLLTVTGNAGNDTINASAVTTAANSVLFVSGAGNDTLTGGAGADTFNFTAANLTSADTVNGGTGASLDTLMFTTAGTIVASALTGVSHIEDIGLASGSNSLTLSDTLVGSADDAHLLTVTGNGGNDAINASAVTTAANNVLFISGAGNDTLTGGVGADTFDFAATDLTSADTVNGGTGASVDTLTFTTVGTVTASAFTHVSHIEKIVLANGTNSLTLSDALVGSSDDSALPLLIVSGNAGNDTIDASAVTTAANRVLFSSGAGDDTLTGGAGADTFNFAAPYLTSADTVNGGTGASLDTLAFTTAGTIAASAFAGVSHIEKIVLANGTNSLVLSDALVGSADDAHLLTVTGNAGNDTINASAVTTAANSVSFNGAGGADVMTAGAGADTFVYAGASDSTGVNYDTITGFNYSADTFDIPGGAGVITGIDTKVASGALSTATFDTNLAAAMTGHLGAHHAVLFTPNSGTLSGATFLVVDLNGTAGYQAGADLVIRMNGATGTLAMGGFH